MQEIMIAIVLGIAVGCSDLLNYNVKNGSAGFLQSVCLSCCCVWVLRSAVMQSFWANWDQLGGKSLVMAVFIIGGSVLMLWLVLKLLQTAARAEGSDE